MKKYSYNDATWSIEYPDNWSAEMGSNGVVSLYNPDDGVGALQFSFYQVPNPEDKVLENELKNYLKDKLNDFNIIGNIDYTYCSYIHEEKRIAWRYWIFLNKNLLIFATYTCEIVDVGNENDIVDGIIQSGLGG